MRSGLRMKRPDVLAGKVMVQETPIAVVDVSTIKRELCNEFPQEAACIINK